MVWQTFNSPKNTNSDDNLTALSSLSSSSSSSTSSLPPPLPLSPPPLISTPISTANIPTSNHIPYPSTNNTSNERSPSPRPPPRFHRPKSSRSYPHNHNNDNNSSGYGSLNTDLPFSMTPAGRFFTQFFDEAMQYFNYPMHDITWSNELPTANGCRGNSTNEKIIDNDEKLCIEIDLSDFVAGELSVSYDDEGRELLVEGHQKERNGRLGSVERNFKRKFDIPIDANDGSLAAYLTPAGQLTIQAFKKGIKQPIRRIPIQEVTDVPNPFDENAANVPTSETTENRTPKSNVNPPVPPKPKKVLDPKSPTFQTMSKTDEKIPKISKQEEKAEKHLNFDEINGAATSDSTAKREYLNIFC
uniref:SHSP domain-containing protein n=1 Tax=Setaria digitata TaxID=48799 RepID=A0A915Q0Y2_9BILA